MPIPDHFDLLAPLYDHLIHPPDTGKLLALLQPDSAGLLLDAGGGTGRIARQVDVSFRHIVLTDASFSMLQQAKGSGFLLTSCYTETMPFPSGTFPRIMMVDALHHIIDHRQTLAECWRVLAPGGRLVVEEPDIRLFRVKLLALAEKLALFRSHFLAPQRIASILAELGAQASIHPDPPNVRIVAVKPAGLSV